jgi:hypothetical protein
VRNFFKKNDLDILWDGSGKNIVFRHNFCKTSNPASICMHSHH